MNITRILGIAPYAGLQDMMRNLANLRDDVEITTFVGDFQQGIQIVQEEDLSDYDVIISRGGTADAIKAISPIPVVAISLSYYDILNAIKIAQNCNEPFAIVGFPSTANFAKMLCSILHYEIEISVTNNEEEVHSCIDQLQQAGCSIVLGDNMIARYASSKGMRSILITSCSESVSTALDQAVEFCRYTRAVRQENLYYRTHYSLSQTNFMVFTPNGELLFSNMQSFGSALQTTVRRLIPSVLTEGFVQALRQVAGNTMQIVGRKRIRHEQTTLYFTISRSNRTLQLQKYGMETLSLSILSNQFINTFYNSKSTADLLQKAATLGSFLSPVLIVGERGSGKDRFAEYIYSHSSSRQDLLYVLDCHTMDSKCFTFMLNSPNSPLLETGHTFYFKDIDSLSAQQWQPLLNYLRSIRASVGNQLIFSIQKQNDLTEVSPLNLFLTDQMECLILDLPPLRYRIHELPTLVSLYLNELNAVASRQVVGLEPEGMTLLQGFLWPGNITQFKKVLKSLVQGAQTPYIYAESVRAALKEEQREHESSLDISAINIDQPLNDIIFDVITQKLAQKGMTQTKAAQQLGICRTTLWKYLNQ